MATPELYNIGRDFAAQRCENKAYLVSEHLEALAVRLQLVESAKHTLDLQYYYWLPDISGKLLALAVIAAADRGVRVRILLDDMNATGLDRTFAALDSHDNISVRLFNPLRFRSNRLVRAAAMFATFVTANRRMHNKSMAVDGSWAIIGGRNIGDAYFGLGAGANFRDLDLLIAGPAATAASTIFESYWESKAARPVSRLTARAPGKIAVLRRRLRDQTGSSKVSELIQALQHSAGLEAREGIHCSNDSLSIQADPPEKAIRSKPQEWLGAQIEALIASAVSELTILSPYFIPGQTGMAQLLAARSRGVRVRLLTNSLAATDVVAAHSGYARYRADLIRAGIEVYEQPHTQKPGRMRLFGSRKASLHTKAILLDGERGFIGSFNFDPRSRSINTEMGVFFSEGALALAVQEQLREHFDECMAVTLEEGNLIWRDNNGKTVSRNAEPHASLKRRLIALLAGALPIESQL